MYRLGLLPCLSLPTKVLAHAVGAGSCKIILNKVGGRWWMMGWLAAPGKGVEFVANLHAWTVAGSCDKALTREHTLAMFVVTW